MTELTQKRLKELLHYEPETGHFTWLTKTAKRVKIGDIAGAITNNGYIIIKIDKKIYLAHRLAFLYIDGKLPEEGLQVDHINHVKNDNSWRNLRIVTHQENHKNRTLNKNNNAGHTGVCWHKATNKWRAQITVDGKQKYLGLFDNLDDAIKARKDAEVKYRYHNNHGKKAD